jgi:hypothetical protein
MDLKTGTRSEVENIEEGFNVRIHMHIIPPPPG